MRAVCVHLMSLIPLLSSSLSSSHHQGQSQALWSGWWLVALVPKSVQHPYLGQVKFPSRASGTDDEVLGEQEALSLTLFLEGQGPQAPPGDLALF